MEVSADLIAGSMEGLAKVHAADPQVAQALGVPVFEAGKLVRVGGLILRPATELPEDTLPALLPVYEQATPVHAYGYDELGNVIYIAVDGFTRMRYPDETDC